MNRFRLEKLRRIEQKIIKDLKNLLKLKKDVYDNIIKGIRNLFNLKNRK